VNLFYSAFWSRTYEMLSGATVQTCHLDKPTPGIFAPLNNGYLNHSRSF